MITKDDYKQTIERVRLLREKNRDYVKREQARIAMVRIGDLMESAYARKESIEAWLRDMSETYWMLDDVLCGHTDAPRGLTRRLRAFEDFAEKLGNSWDIESPDNRRAL